MLECDSYITELHAYDFVIKKGYYVRRSLESNSLDFCCYIK